jgi:hypothetical protein
MTAVKNTSNTSHATTPAELVAHHILKLVGEQPVQVGPLRCARIVGGYTVPAVRDQHGELFDLYAIPQRDWTLRMLKELVEALERGGLLVRSGGPRPTLALTRAGHRALDALEHVPAQAHEVNA